MTGVGGDDIGSRQVPLFRVCSLVPVSASGVVYYDIRICSCALRSWDPPFLAAALALSGPESAFRRLDRLNLIWRHRL